MTDPESERLIRAEQERDVALGDLEAMRRRAEAAESKWRAAERLLAKEQRHREGSE